MEALIAQAMSNGRVSAESNGFVGSVLLSAPEAERIIEHLRTFSIEEVGTAKWMQQHDHINQLNLQVIKFVKYNKRLLARVHSSIVVCVEHSVSSKLPE